MWRHFGIIWNFTPKKTYEPRFRAKAAIYEKSLILACTLPTQNLPKTYRKPTKTYPKLTQNLPKTYHILATKSPLRGTALMIRFSSILFLSYHFECLIVFILLANFLAYLMAPLDSPWLSRNGFALCIFLYLLCALRTPSLYSLRPDIKPIMLHVWKRNPESTLLFKDVGGLHSK